MKWLRDPTIIEAYIHLADYVNQSLIFLVGRGFGGAVAAYMARKEMNLFRGVILESTFKSVPELIVKDYFPWFESLHFLFVRLHWNVINKVEDLLMPICYIHGEKDTVVPFWHSEDLFEDTDEAKFRKLYLFSKLFQKSQTIYNQ